MSDQKLRDTVLSFLYDRSLVVSVISRPSYGEWIFYWDSCFVILVLCVVLYLLAAFVTVVVS